MHLQAVLLQQVHKCLMPPASLSFLRFVLGQGATADGARARPLAAGAGLCVGKLHWHFKIWLWMEPPEKKT
jgi:hypothetical protein